MLFSLDPAANRIAVGGMEANLFLFCSLLGLVLYFHHKKFLAFIILAVIYFLRPEALILFVVLMGYEWYSTKKMPWKYAVACLLVMALPLYGMLHYYGNIIPQSVLAKNQGPQGSFSALVRVLFFPWPFMARLKWQERAGILRSLPAGPFVMPLRIVYKAPGS